MVNCGAVAFLLENIKMAAGGLVIDKIMAARRCSPLAHGFTNNHVTIIVAADQYFTGCSQYHDIRIFSIIPLLICFYCRLPTLLRPSSRQILYSLIFDADEYTIYSSWRDALFYFSFLAFILYECSFALFRHTFHSAHTFTSSSYQLILCHYCYFYYAHILSLLARIFTSFFTHYLQLHILARFYYVSFSFILTFTRRPSSHADVAAFSQHLFSHGHLLRSIFRCHLHSDYYFMRRLIDGGRRVQIYCID